MLRHALRPAPGIALVSMLATIAACGGGVIAPGSSGTNSSSSGSGAGSGSSGSGAGSGSSSGASGSSTSGSGGGGPGTDAGGPSPAAYPGHGFVVHEWGTDTIVVGSDGTPQRGLHHEEEDLPAFVYDRIKAAQELGGPPSVEVKMETPVTYFYSDKPLAVSASVDFPQGVFTQWYPGVGSFAPSVAGPGSELGSQPTTYADPTLDVSFPFQNQTCRDHYTQIAGGHLDWGTVEVLPRGSPAQLLDAPLAQFSWSYARQVASNPVRTQGGQLEQFLFYRGLGNFELPARVTASTAGGIVLANQYAQAMGPVFVLDVGATSGAFKSHPEGIAPGASLSDVAPSLEGAPGLDAYAQALGEAVTSALESVGLYHDESVAMVSTWNRQWFRTPGLRLLYIAPQSWTEASIPLTVQPAPDATTRVMLIRVEVLTPEIEAADVQAAGGLASTTTAAQAGAYFTALGRFAEPRLRRALALLGNPSYGDTLLAQVATANTDVSSGE